MNREDVLKQMKDSVGTKEPTAFFAQMVDALSLLFDRIDDLEKELKTVQINSTLAIHWDPRLAEKMISDEIQTLRRIGKQLDGPNMWENEIKELQSSYMTGNVVVSYPTFCTFWQDLLGYHPFLEHRK